MANDEDRLVVLDAGPLIHLHELNCLRLLSGFKSLVIPMAVWAEAQSHRPTLRLDEVPGAEILASPSTTSERLMRAAEAFQLHSGELAALAILEEINQGIFLSDDDAARRAAEMLGFEVTGTLGLVLRGIRRGFLSPEGAIAILRDIRSRSTLHLSQRVLERVIESIETVKRA